MGWKTIDIKCDVCDTLIIGELVLSEEVDNHFACIDTTCKGKMKRTLSAPNFTKASYVDGRRDHKGRQLIEAAKIEATAGDMKPKDRKAADREIKRLRSNKT